VAVAVSTTSDSPLQYVMATMNAHARAIDDFAIGHIDPFDTIDPEITHNAKGLWRIYRWAFFPAGWWVEADGSLVIFDRRYHPLCRKRPDGSIEVLPMKDFDTPMHIKFKSQHRLYSGGLDHACDDERTQQRLLGVVQRLGIEDEVARRYAAYQRRKAEARRRFLRHYR
jgi:hypothetical protein